MLPANGRMQVFIYCKFTQHVSGDHRTHNQEYKKIATHVARVWQELHYTYLNGKEYSYYRHVILTAGNHYSIVGVTTTKTRFYVFDIHKFTFYKEMFLAIQHHYSAVISYNTNYRDIFLYPARSR